MISFVIGRVSGRHSDLKRYGFLWIQFGGEVLLLFLDDNTFPARLIERGITVDVAFPVRTCAGERVVGWD